MSEITINGNVTGNNHHIGDTYINAGTFLKNHSNFDNDEKELVKLIFEHIDLVDKRGQLLKSLEKIKANKNQSGEDSEKRIWKKFIDQLIDAGLKESAKTTITYLKSKAPKIAIFINSLSQGIES